jgi:outer membrane protein assembly factor BamE (lipoprotein component of BamABCDE complex)
MAASRVCMDGGVFMKQWLKVISTVAVSVWLLGGCAADPAVKPWWTVQDADLRKLQPGKTTKEAVRTALGKPVLESAFPRQGEEVWDYRFVTGTEIMLAWVYFDSKGVFKHYTAQPDPAYKNSDGQP